MRNVNICIASKLDTLQACVIINIKNESLDLQSKSKVLASKRLSDKPDFDNVRKKCLKNCGYVA